MEFPRPISRVSSMTAARLWAGQISNIPPHLSSRHLLVRGYLSDLTSPPAWKTKLNLQPRVDLPCSHGCLFRCDALGPLVPRHAGSNGATISSLNPVLRSALSVDPLDYSHVAMRVVEPQQALRWDSKTETDPAEASSRLMLGQGSEAVPLAGEAAPYLVQKSHYSAVVLLDPESKSLEPEPECC